jgi:hypothetical protein
MKDLPVLKPDAGVILVASGYQFRCPECDAIGYVASALNPQVRCNRCKAEFPVIEVRHRTHDLDLAPGVAPEALYIPQEGESQQGEEELDQTPKPRKGRGKKQTSS